MKLPLGNPRYRKLARALSTSLGISGLAVWFFHFYVWDQYDRTRTIHPDYSSGRVHGLNNHGHVVYLTDEEDSRLTKLRIIAFSLAASAGLTLVFFVEGFSIWSKGRPPWEKRQF